MPLHRGDRTPVQVEPSKPVRLIKLQERQGVGVGVHTLLRELVAAYVGDAA